MLGRDRSELRIRQRHPAGRASRAGAERSPYGRRHKSSFQVLLWVSRRQPLRHDLRLEAASPVAGRLDPHRPVIAAQRRRPSSGSGCPPLPPGGAWPRSEPSCSLSPASIARSTSRPLSCANRPPGPTISSSLLAPASSSSINSSPRRSRTAPGSCPTPSWQPPPRSARPTGSPRRTTARATDASTPCCELVDMRSPFAHADTKNRTDPRGREPRGS